ncbi:tyrosine-type recombinase/integrase [Aliamphritea hakodatensis]|uniref:tyrosine-type recombinase/integrase n=1 Tax=Aliamphritea hakodatensis TaxID=2895352 RepID=UPI0022FD9BBA|nr:site-specific integrase [Aliamphritea hakodatensis]
MATISKRKRVDGSFSYTAQIRIKQKREVVYTESETFSKKALAKAWADRREAELKMPGVLEKMLHVGVSIGQVVRWYRDDFHGLSKFGRSKLSSINYLINHPELSEIDALTVTAADLVAYIHSRRAEGAGPSTVNNDLIWLRNAFRAVKIGRNIPLSLEPLDDAAYLCRKEKVIAKSKKRDRRPTLAELDRLIEHFGQKRKAQIPMGEVILFALFSSRRQDEICRIRWADVDTEKQRVLVREMKHPLEKIDTWVFLPDRAWEVLQRQPKDNELIFPYNGKSVSAAFTRACKLVGIEDLRFHDLRHECASWLFEQGLDIPRVAGVTGHKSWSSLQRYTHLSEQGVFDKYDKWRVWV